MSESIKCEQDKDRNELFSFIPFSVCVALVLILAYISGSAPIKNYELADSDCYLRLLRVENLHKGGNWHDPVILRINPPYGQTSHWTRPFDVLLLTGAMPLSLFTDFESALFWWGVIISPVLLIATLIALQWSAKPLLTNDGPFLAGCVFITQLMILAYYMAGRPDHHSLIAFAYVLSMGFTFRIIQRPVSTRLCYIAGAIGAFSMWISVESMVSVGITIAVLGLLWLLENEDFARKSLHYSLALFVATGLSLVIERSWHSLFVDEYDSLSIVHFSIFGSITILWITIYMLNHRTQLFRRRASRFLTIPVGAAMLALAILVSYPKFFKGPLAGMDPRLMSLWFDKIAEIQSLIPKAGSLAIPAQLIASSVLCLPLLSYLLLKDSKRENRRVWLYVLFSYVIFMAASLYQIRWSIYPQILLTVPLAQLMLFLRQRGPQKGLSKTLKNSLILVIFTVGLLFLSIFADRAIAKKGDSAKRHQEVSLIRICHYLAQAKEWDSRNSLILTNVDFGAEILYRTEYKVLGTPHASGTPSRNGQGILDTYDIMTADTDEQALEIIRRRNIDLILLCPGSTESVFYSKPGDKSTFYKRLLNNTVPNCLRKIELPNNLSSSFLLFKVLDKSG